MTASLFEKFGATELPVELGDLSATARTFEALDPGRDLLVDLFSAAIRAEFGTGTGSAWYLVTSSLSAGSVLRNSTDPIGFTLKLEPSQRILNELRVTWPLLAVHRTGEAEYRNRTFQVSERVQKWAVHWIMGPMTAGEMHKFCDAPVAVAGIISRVCQLGAHPAYNGGAQSFYDVFSGVTFLKHAAGQARFSEDEDLVYYAMSSELETVERVRLIDEGAELLGLTMTLGVGDDVEILPELVTADSDYVSG
jgi:hypothetical protein